MHSFFKKVSEINKKIHNVSLMIVDGIHCGEKALWTENGFIYMSSDLPVWQALEPELSQVKGPVLKTFDGYHIFCEALASHPSLPKSDWQHH